MAHNMACTKGSSCLQVVIALVILQLLAVACAPQALSTRPGDYASAHSTLLAFFEALNPGRYAEAASFYGGSYEELIHMNPDVEPGAAATMLERGCRLNGFQCLRIKEVVEVVQSTTDEYRFKVRFEARDGGAFVLGPCCGATETEQPRVDVFEYVVARMPEHAGAFRVQALPVYVP